MGSYHGMKARPRHPVPPGQKLVPGGERIHTAAPLPDRPWPLGSHLPDVSGTTRPGL
ncbi:hypothetical protein J6590_047059 [Homalodisca vitripennis]|nr:hypothetical protein J6590_047059 [Homalodisca vitripennis]